jgi:hypothetical protein
MQYLYYPNLRQKHKNRVWSPPGIEPTTFRLPPRVETTQRNSDAHIGRQYHIHTKQISDKNSSTRGIAHVCVSRRCMHDDPATPSQVSCMSAWRNGTLSGFTCDHIPRIQIQSPAGIRTCDYWAAGARLDQLTSVVEDKSANSAVHLLPCDCYVVVIDAWITVVTVVFSVQY